jgi:hypothetical protein
MHLIRLSVALCLALVAIPAAAASPSLPGERADELEAQPHMKAALASLSAAKVQLDKASNDKGGHRAKALAQVKIAITETKSGIAFDNATPKANVSDDSVELVDAQPHMRAALGLLQTARNQLEKATSDKGGHRAKAIKAVDLAISETRQGIQFDNHH